MDTSSSALNNILIPFDCIIDIDVGLLKLINNKYFNDEIFHTRLINLEDIFIKNMLVYNIYSNPLELILKEDYLNKKDIFYKQFMRDELDNILSNSVFTDIHKFVELSLKTGMSNIQILCSNQKEYDYINTVFNKKIDTVIKENYEEVNIKDIDSIFIKRYSDILKFKNLKGKYIYILDYNFNLEGKNEKIFPNMEITSKITKSNIIYMISVYDKEEIKTEVYG